MRHAHQHPRRRCGAGQHAGEHADERAEVDGHAERRNAGLGGQQVQGAGGVAERAGFAAKTQHLRVRAKHEEDAGEERALQHGAGNGAQRIARFAAQRGGALKPDEAEDGEHQRRAQSGE